MLVAKQDTETYFFISFIERAINGEDIYYQIVKPIILDALKYANKEITISKLDRNALTQKLMLQSFEQIKDVTEDNLMLPEILNFFKQQI